ncbi:hypothetical protein CRUP_030840 [Coryphaenoides rupestris]|nr:hypothetical protein CRUP_030840 [Coryphaenoides rupestris]
MASIPAGGSLVATTDYYRRRIGSTSSSSSCSSSEFSGEVIPHHPGLPKQDSGHWAGVQDVVRAEHITCVAKEMVTQRQQSQGSESGTPTSP